MKTKLGTTILLSAFIVSLLLAGGCSKKTVVPPDAKTESSSTELSDGKTINYPSAQSGFSEENMPTEGRLDDSASNRSMAGSAINIDQQSDQYKREHGRSSANFSPIYFDFDQARINTEMGIILMQNADYLKSSPGIRIVIEGNCDERGTNEYNLALGERRAINTQQFLVNLGIDQTRMRTVSYGEERPLFLGMNEDAYAENRRVDFAAE
jgi:peptidoglycan-associated lipoprotein